MNAVHFDCCNAYLYFVLHFCSRPSWAVAAEGQIVTVARWLRVQSEIWELFLILCGNAKFGVVFRHSRQCLKLKRIMENFFFIIIS